jgi:hypothetical protein
MQQTVFDTDGFDLPTAEAPDLDSYDKILVAFSGGKDSIGCVLHLLDSGVSPDRMELWHHEVDGREGSFLFDWPVTPAYCRAFAEAFGIPIYFSWKKGGLVGEMYRENAPTAPTAFETPDGTVQETGGRGPVGTRRKFPAVTASLTTRWCSSYMKISVADAALRNQERFLGLRALFVTGERAEESRQRAQYKPFEPHRSDNRAGRPAARRHIDHWRPVLYWEEKRIWEIIERYRVEPHPAYHLGISRTSCAFCIFGGSKQMRTAREALPGQFEQLANIEVEFDHTMKHGCSLRELTDHAEPYQAAADNPAMLALAASTTFDVPIITDNWSLPAGAYGNSSGPA